MPTVIIPPTDVSPNTGTGSEVLSNAPTLVNPIITGTIDVSGNITAADLILGTSGPSVKSTLSARAPRQGIVSDSVNNLVPIANTQAFGIGDYTLSLFYNPSTLAVDTWPLYSSAANGGGIQVNATTGTITIRQNSVGNLTNSTGAIVANKMQHIAAVRSGSTVTYYINGVSAGTAVDNRNYTVATNAIYAQGVVAQPLIYNRALSASEVVALYESGAPSGADYNNASNTALNGAAFSNGNFTTFTSASATGFTATNTSGSEKYAQSNNTFAVTLGQRIRVIYSLSGTGTVSAKLAETGVQNLSSPQTLTAGTSQQVTFVVTTASANCVLHVTSAGSTDNFTLSSVNIDRPGLLLAPDAAQAGGGLTWYDTSGNAANITLPASGVSWNVPSSGYWGGNLTVSGGTISSGAGNTLLLQQANYGGGLSANASGQVIVAAYNSQPLRLQTQGADVLYLTSGGNLLVGTTTDSSNGKLQLATHTTSAGGIGFGTDLSLSRFSTSGLGINTTASTTGLLAIGNSGVTASGSAGLNLQLAVNDGYLWNRQNGPLYFGTNNTLALTLDSSQNATFAGWASIRGTGSGSAQWIGDDGADGWFLNVPTSNVITLGINNTSRVVIKANTVQIVNLPTSSSGLNPGDLWNDSGTVKIA